MKLSEFLELNEQSSGNVSGHFGRGGPRGQEVDDIFAGGFKGNDNVIDVLQQQLDDRKMKIDWMKGTTDVDVDEQNPLGGYFDINTDELIDTYKILGDISSKNIEFSEKNTPPSQFKWESLPIDYKFDDDSEIEKDFSPKYDDNDGYDKSDKFKNKFKNDSDKYLEITDEK
tara:strand:+ start:2691 stop:3203 length:513 start_codon:yes stop_codon:yes gene_type:complete